jgi:hypothetical protein
MFLEIFTSDSCDLGNQQWGVPCEESGQLVTVS